MRSSRDDNMSVIKKTLLTLLLVFTVFCGRTKDYEHNRRMDETTKLKGKITNEIISLFKGNLYYFFESGGKYFISEPNVCACETCKKYYKKAFINSHEVSN